MKILKAGTILTCNNDFEILQNKAIAFDSQILAIDDFIVLQKLYPEAQILDFSNDIVMPAFINSHTHLEFSANRTDLSYGDFIVWLKSVIKNRENLSKEATDKLIDEAILTMQRSGVATIGEISSFGLSLNSCIKSSARIVYFNEILGLNEENLDQIWQSFLARFQASNLHKNSLFIPALSVHSPYSTHKILTQKACKFAKENKLLVSTHLLESSHEKRWLASGQGEFKTWLTNFTQNPKPHYDFDEFLSNFKGIKTLFTHCVFVQDFSKFDKNLHSITHCGVSNRLLGKNRLNLLQVLEENLPLNIATDGLSSNISLNFFDELRADLFLHDEFEINSLARILLLASTNYAARSLGLNLGIIESGKIADIIVIDSVNLDSQNLALNIILHTKNVKKLFIEGNLCKI